MKYLSAKVGEINRKATQSRRAGVEHLHATFFVDGLARCTGSGLRNGRHQTLPIRPLQSKSKPALPPQSPAPQPQSPGPPPQSLAPYEHDRACSASTVASVAAPCVVMSLVAPTPSPSTQVMMTANSPVPRGLPPVPRGLPSAIVQRRHHATASEQRVRRAAVQRREFVPLLRVKHVPCDVARVLDMERLKLGKKEDEWITEAQGGGNGCCCVVVAAAAAAAAAAGAAAAGASPAATGTASPRAPVPGAGRGGTALNHAQQRTNQAQHARKSRRPCWRTSVGRAPAGRWWARPTAFPPRHMARPPRCARRGRQSCRQNTTTGRAAAPP
jgi:hypothetical protein